MENGISLQYKIRQNATEMNDYLKDLSLWEKKMKEKDNNLVKRDKTMDTKNHIYSNNVTFKSKPEINKNKDQLKSEKNISCKEMDKIEANKYYKLGKYEKAIEYYTKCLTYDTKDNHIIYSNRSMAYLKLKNYILSEIDATQAIKIDNNYIKSYIRRGSARNALGKHHLALIDFYKAIELIKKDSNNGFNLKEIENHIKKTREFMKVSIKRTPQTRVYVEGINLDTKCNNQKEIKEQEVKETKELSKNTSVNKSNNIQLNSSYYINLPKNSPRTWYEFSRIWKSLQKINKNEDNTNQNNININTVLNQREKFLIYIMEPKSIPKVFKNSLEPDIFTSILQTCVDVLKKVQISKDNENGKQIINHMVTLLSFLSKVPRFTMAINLLGPQEQEFTEKLFILFDECFNKYHIIDEKNYKKITLLKEKYIISKP